MRYFALASDYDGTLAHHGKIDDGTRAALERLRASGRKLLMVTGRELEDLQKVCPELPLFDRVVAENGALLFNPGDSKERVLAERPPDAFVAELKRRGVGPISVGRVIVATWSPHEATVVEVIRDLGLELQVIFNKGAVMVLPSGVNKATGLREALAELSLSPHNAVAVGDAENDHAFLSACECGVAVANALPALKERADVVTRADHGAGVTELIDRLLADDLADWTAREKHSVLIGAAEDKSEVSVSAYGECLMLAGSSGSGKSTLATGILERLGEQGYQYCIIDPEGDYSTFEAAMVLGDPHGAPSVQEVLELLENPKTSAVVNLVGIALAHRPKFFETLMPRLHELRVRTGRPHWLVVDETHHLMPLASSSTSIALPQDLGGTMFVTVHPESVSPAALQAVDTLIAVGEKPEETIASFCRAVDEPPPELKPMTLEPGQVIVWQRRKKRPPLLVNSVPPKTERRRHSRKYAEGDLGPDRSFYFRGPQEKLNLQAQNLNMFLQMADGVDDDTWRHHLRRGDYSAWFRSAIKDPDLADEAQPIEKMTDAAPAETRAMIRKLIEKNYTLSE